jgi:hypothetical protein
MTDPVPLYAQPEIVEDSTEWTSRTAEADTGQPRAQSGSCTASSLGPAKVRQDVAIDRAPVVGHSNGRDGPDLLAPLQPTLDQLAHRPRAVAAALAPVDLL